MAKNIQRCIQCGKLITDGGLRMMLAHGPRGFRKYAAHAACAERAGVPAPRTGGRQLAAERAAMKLQTK